MSLADELHRNGVVVVNDPFYSENLVRLRKEFEEALLTFPEFKHHPTLARIDAENTYVLGGFSALGNPSSFHNPFVRRLREWCMYTLVTQLFTEFIAKHVPQNYGLEHIVDRLMVRPPKASPSKESWHRDEAPLASADDLTFGGWINLDTQDQFFSCVPGSHITARKAGGQGFAKIKPGDKLFKEMEARKSLIRVPPGGILIFYEHIVHEVVARKRNYTSIRLFLGWRLTASTTPLIPGVDVLLRDQAVMPLKSNQIPPMHAKLHWTNWRTQLEQWSQRMMRAECLATKRVESGAKKGETHQVVHTTMRSLAEYGLPLYPKYTPSEIRILKPGREFHLLAPGHHRLRHTLQW